MTTRQFNAQFHCSNCRTWQTQETMFGRWIRNNPELDSASGYAVSDQDYWIHAYKTHGSRDFQCLMLVEIKTMGRELSTTQRDTLHIVNQLMRNRKETPTTRGANIKQAGSGLARVYSSFLGRKVNLKALGMHVLTFSGLGPDDSDLITWDKKKIDLPTLTKLLRFDLDPDTLRPLDLRNHHRTALTQNLSLPLSGRAEDAA